jgi:hypothetical protein
VPQGVKILASLSNSDQLAVAPICLADVVWTPRTLVSHERASLHLGLAARHAIGLPLPTLDAAAMAPRELASLEDNMTNHELYVRKSDKTVIANLIDALRSIRNYAVFAKRKTKVPTEAADFDSIEKVAEEAIEESGYSHL